MSIAARRVSRGASVYKISTPSGSTSRLVPVVINAPNAPFFKLSESPDFKESAATGPTVTINSVDANKRYADLSITYPGGVTSANSTPFSISSETAQPQMLVVLFDVEEYVTLSSRTTLSWITKVFNTGDSDGRGKDNSFRKLFEQQSYGVMTPQFDIHPQVVHLTRSEVLALRNLESTSSPATQVLPLIADKLVAQGFIDPLNNPYEGILAFGPGCSTANEKGSQSFYRIHYYPWNYQGFEGGYLGDVPIDNASPLTYQHTNEPAVVDSHGVVILPYNATSVTGVWLATDTTHTGTNYYASLTYGQVDSSRPTGVYAGGHIDYVKLNAVLSTGTAVIVTYQPTSNFIITNHQHYQQIVLSVLFGTV